MLTTKEFTEELKDLAKRVQSGPRSLSSEDECNVFQEKLSDAKAALARLRERGDDALEELKEHGDEIWSEFEDRLQDLRSFVDSRLEERSERDQ